MRIELGADKSAGLQVLAELATASFPLTATLTNLAPRHLYLGVYLAAAGTAEATKQHVFASMDAVQRLVGDVQQIAETSGYASVVVLEVEHPVAAKPAAKPEPKAAAKPDAMKE